MEPNQSRGLGTKLPRTTPIDIVALIGILLLISIALKYGLGPAVLLIALPYTLAVAWFRPEILLAISILLSLLGDDYNQYSRHWVVLLLGVGVVAALKLSLTRPSLSPVTWLTVTLLLYLILRISLEGDSDDALLFLRPIAAILLVLASESDPRRSAASRVPGALGLTGTVFLFLSIYAGAWNSAGTRFEGISANPNRMVFGLLLLLPFTLHATRQFVPIFRYPFIAGVVVSSTWLLLASGSSQAVIAPISIALFLFARIWGRTSTIIRGVGLLFTATVVALSLPLLLDLIENDQDLSSLSGRTPLFQLAISDFQSSPLIGTGMLGVTDEAGDYRSSHSSWLGLAATGGIVALVGWTAVLANTSLWSFRCSHRSVPIALAGFSLVLIQFVQSVEYSPLTWTVVAIASTNNRHCFNCEDRED